MEITSRATILLLFTLLAACEEQAPVAVGMLMSDRVEITVEYAEPISAIHVVEGDRVSAGDLLAEQLADRIQARLQEERANMRRSEAFLAEQIAGPRQEEIDVARAQVREREIEHRYRINELARLGDLRERNLTSEESVDLAQNRVESAGASLDIALAQLRELEIGTRGEQIEQTRQTLEQSRARIAQLEIEEGRHRLTAPVEGLIDSLPFEIGERPRAGDVVAVMLSGSQPHARVYVPEVYIVSVAPGDTVQLSVDGIEGTLAGTVRNVSRDPSFTPYFALTESDRSRLSYVAEILLPQLPDRLPDGVPVEAHFSGTESIDE